LQERLTNDAVSCRVVCQTFEDEVDDMEIMEIVGEFNFQEFEMDCYRSACQKACLEMQNKLEELDKIICQQRDKTIYRYQERREGTIKTVAGEVTYRRVYYKATYADGTTEYVYLLDTILKMKSIGLFSNNLLLDMVETVSAASYRETARAISALGGQSVSHVGVWNVVQTMGHFLDAVEETRIEKAHQFLAPGEKECPVLFVELDGVSINMQGKDRPKGKRKAEMKMGIFYNGWSSRKTKKGNRYETHDKRLLMGFDSSEQFKNRMYAAMADEYNLDEIAYIFVNSDGAGWAKRFCDGHDDAYHQLDLFHRHRALFAVSDRKKRKKIAGLLKERKLDDALSLIQQCRDSCDKDKPDHARLEGLYTYFTNNKESLIPIQDRPQIPVPSPPEGLVYRGMGTMEHNVCDWAALRMKHRKASWSKAGANSLGQILGRKASGTLRSILDFPACANALAAAMYEDTPISAAKAPKKDGHGFSYPVRGALPFEGMPRTGGRKAIRQMASYTSL
jgi:hypothetical protein